MSAPNNDCLCHNFSKSVLIQNDKIIQTTINSKEKISVAKKRWGLLAKALQSPTQLTTHLDKISLRRFSSYTLIESNRLLQDVKNSIHEEWYEYTARLDENHAYSVIICHPQRTFTPAELSGFNNTGNICIWPSEETLAYYSLSNPSIFTGRTVLELGGGMSCLAGLMIATHLNSVCVHLTDGNATAVDNVYRSIKNNIPKNNCLISCSVLKWNRNENIKDIIPYDIIICADCLFFDEYRIDLIETIWNRLTDNGIALAMAPNRENCDSSVASSENTGSTFCRVTDSFL